MKLNSCTVTQCSRYNERNSLLYSLQGCVQLNGWVFAACCCEPLVFSCMLDRTVSFPFSGHDRVCLMVIHELRRAGSVSCAAMVLSPVLQRSGAGREARTALIKEPEHLTSDRAHSSEHTPTQTHTHAGAYTHAHSVDGI